MACPTNLQYPDYIKSVINTINAENNKTLKSCLCSNKIPRDENGCAILDENGKAGLFPFCAPIVENGVGDDTNYPLKLTLKQAMSLYWKVNSWTFKAANFVQGCGACTYSIDFNGSQIYGSVPIMKERVCKKAYNFLTNYTTENCCVGSIPPCSTASETGVIVASLFDDPDAPMKCKKEGSVYYFYPIFSIGISHYSVSAAQTQSAANDLLGIGPKENMPPLTKSVKIIDSNVNFRYYRAKWANSEGPPPCSYNPTMDISQLDFNS